MTLISTRKSATAASFALVIIMMVGTFVREAYAENNATSVNPVIESVRFNKVVNKTTKKLAPCGKRCVDQKIEQVHEIMSKATTASSGGLTRYTCKQAQVESILDDLHRRAPKVTVTFDQGWDDFPCTFVYNMPRSAVR